nr:hypothetical protein CFP56_69491 [Quercus suber]
MSVMYKRENDALNVNGNTVNGRTADIAITTHGSDWYWAVTAVMVVATFIFMGLALMKPRQQRIFHYITASITLVASIAYFSMGSNLGFTPIAVEFQRSDHTVAGFYREIFYVRYIDWFITTPLLLMDLLLTAALPWPTVLFVILIDEVMIVTGLVGALVQSSYKWGYFVFGCVALFYILYVLIWEARKHANAMGSDVGRVFLMCGTLTAFLWTLYPIAWGVCEGGNVIAPDSEAVFYGILDLLAKPVFGGLLLFGHRGIDPARLGLHIHDYDEKDMAIHGEKGASKGAASEENGTSNGTSSGVTNGASTGATTATTTTTPTYTTVANNATLADRGIATNETSNNATTATHGAGILGSGTHTSSSHNMTSGVGDRLVASETGCTHAYQFVSVCFRRCADLVAHRVLAMYSVDSVTVRELRWMSFLIQRTANEHLYAQDKRRFLLTADRLLIFFKTATSRERRERRFGCLDSALMPCEPLSQDFERRSSGPSDFSLERAFQQRIRNLTSRYDGDVKAKAACRSKVSTYLRGMLIIVLMLLPGCLHCWCYLQSEVVVHPDEPIRVLRAKRLANEQIWMSMRPSHRIPLNVILCRRRAYHHSAAADHCHPFQLPSICINMETTKAIVCSPPNQKHTPGINWSLQQIQVPTRLGDGELLVEMVAVGVCHTDIMVSSFPAGAPGVSYPQVLGHEGSGFVKAVGPNCTRKLKIGDPILLSYDSCMSCHYCKANKRTYCSQFMPYNMSAKLAVFKSENGADVAGKFFGQSSFAALSIVRETCVLPARELIQNEQELALFAPLGCGLQTGAGAVLNMAKPQPEDRVLITGLGGVGLAALMAAVIAGARQIVAVDRVQSRIDLAKSMGATHGLNTTGVDDTVAAMREITGGLGPTSTGAPPIIEAAYQCVANQGSMTLVVSLDPFPDPYCPYGTYSHLETGRNATARLRDEDQHQFSPHTLDQITWMH